MGDRGLRDQCVVVVLLAGHDLVVRVVVLRHRQQNRPAAVAAHVAVPRDLFVKRRPAPGEVVVQRPVLVVSLAASVHLVPASTRTHGRTASGQGKTRG